MLTTNNQLPVSAELMIIQHIKGLCGIMDRKTDRRIAKTRAAIQRAYVESIMEKGTSAIPVSS